VPLHGAPAINRKTDQDMARVGPFPVNIGYQHETQVI
jgi:hypothetical protein